MKARALADATHDMRVTHRTVRVSEKAIGWIHAMCHLKRPLRNPARLIKGRSGLIKHELADTTNVKHCRLGPRSGRRFMSYLSEYCFSSHSQPPSVILNKVKSGQGKM
jgi:hypothetical protein